MPNNFIEFLDAHEGLVDKDRGAECPFDLLAEVERGGDCSRVLDATMYADGSMPTVEGHYMVYRRCAKLACAAECGMVLKLDGTILDAARFVASCTGKL